MTFHLRISARYVLMLMGRKSETAMLATEMTDDVATRAIRKPVHANSLQSYPRPAPPLVGQFLENLQKPRSFCIASKMRSTTSFWCFALLL